MGWSIWPETHCRKALDSSPSGCDRIEPSGNHTAAGGAITAAGASAPKVLVNASAIGFYGSSLTERFLESSGLGGDFLASSANVGKTQRRVPAGVRQVSLRIGIVLAADGGALGKMPPVFRPVSRPDR